MFPVFAPLTQDKTDYCTRCIRAVMLPPSLLCGWLVQYFDKNSRFKGRINREHPNEQSNRRQKIKIRRWERWDCYSLSKIGKVVRGGRSNGGASDGMEQYARHGRWFLSSPINVWSQIFPKPHTKFPKIGHSGPTWPQSEAMSKDVSTEWFANYHGPDSNHRLNWSSCPN